ncbi:hypothetical protein GCL60_11920 [Silvanigrella paludirubra]|uniref:Uncharacterized protein n=1 Tax=Silvanigrella paludirubra TaxID=2499159 RepID=A0A6N6VVJ2_9BACT|nr:hypothetical protein [Silvanigrella paludirubra]KAB8037875.1 hypothetical protein GCL60_11920 [Silvanigrella paludirubra]
MLKKIAFLSFVFCFPYSAFGQSCADGERLYELTQYTNINVKTSLICGIAKDIVKTQYYYDGKKTKITTFNGVRVYNRNNYVVFESIDTVPSYEYFVSGDQTPPNEN